MFATEGLCSCVSSIHIINILCVFSIKSNSWETKSRKPIFQSSLFLTRSESVWIKLWRCLTHFGNAGEKVFRDWNSFTFKEVLSVKKRQGISSLIISFLSRYLLHVIRSYCQKLCIPDKCSHVWAANCYIHVDFLLSLLIASELSIEVSFWSDFHRSALHGQFFRTSRAHNFESVSTLRLRGADL